MKRYFYLQCFCVLDEKTTVSDKRLLRQFLTDTESLHSFKYVLLLNTRQKCCGHLLRGAAALISEDNAKEHKTLNVHTLFKMKYPPFKF